MLPNPYALGLEPFAIGQFKGFYYYNSLIILDINFCSKTVVMNYYDFVSGSQVILMKRKTPICTAGFYRAFVGWIAIAKD
jgi:hypothetical protein